MPGQKSSPTSTPPSDTQNHRPPSSDGFLPRQPPSDLELVESSARARRAATPSSPLLPWVNRRPPAAAGHGPDLAPERPWTAGLSSLRSQPSDRGRSS